MKNRVINFKKDEVLMAMEINSESIYFEHSYHSQKRASQRGIRNCIIEYAIQFGNEIFKQGLIFYAVAQKNIPLTIDASIREKLKNMVVIMAGDSNQIITCYKSNNAFKHIRKKYKINFN